MPAVVKEWHLRPHDADRATRLGKELGVSAVVAQLLLNRNINNADDGRLFLDAPLTALHPPELLPGIPEAAERITRAIADRKKLCVYGDYDVDGTTGTAILLGLFRLLGADAQYYVPNRMEEGYGLNSEALRNLAAEGVQLVVTVDCGISGVEEADEAERLGLELIITDHHSFKDQLPRALIVHPRLDAPKKYPWGELSGAGVAFKLAWAIAQRAGGGKKATPECREYLLRATAITALGLVADVVPLRDENRSFVRHGLRQLHASPSAGMKALVEAAGLADAATIRAEDVGFRLAPRLNAAGRLECARLAVELLTTDDPRKGKELAEYLEELNKRRQTQERKVVQEAKELVEKNGHLDDAGIVVASPDWHQGVVGIAAARLVDAYGRPVLLISLKENDEPSTGSGRSIPGFALNEALRECEEFLVSHGGHAAAVGLKVRPSNLDNLRKRFSSAVASKYSGNPPPPRITLEVEAPLSSLTLGLIRDLDKLEPYGAENPRPKFLATGLQVVGTPKILKERHLAFQVRQGNSDSIRCIAFGMAERLEELMSDGGRCSLAFTPKPNHYVDRDGNEWRRVEIHVDDLRAGASPLLV